MNDDLGIEYDGGYDPTNPVHNPAGYMRALQEAESEIKAEAFKALKERVSDRPGYFAKLHLINWIIIISLCFFVGYLFTLA